MANKKLDLNSIMPYHIEMELNAIDPAKLQADPETQTLWFRSDDGDLFIIFKRRELVYFEITKDNQHLEGGYQRQFRYGTLRDKSDPQQVLEDEQTHYKMSRLIDFEDSVPQDFRKLAIELVYASQNLEKAMKEGIMRYLSSEGKEHDLLLNTSDYESFREITPEGFSLGKFLRKNKKPLSFLFPILIFGFVFYYSFQFLTLDRDETATKSCAEGNKDACQKIAFSSLVKGRGADANRYNEMAKSLEGLRTNTKKEKLKKLCQEDNIESCHMLNDLSQPKDVELLEIACSKGRGDKTACQRVAARFDRIIWELPAKYYRKHPGYLAYLYASTPDNNLVQKLDVYYQEQVACESGKMESCFQAALNFMEKGYRSKAGVLFERVCQKQGGAACLEAAKTLIEGTKVQQYARKSCEDKILEGCLFYKLQMATTIKEKQALRDAFRSCREGDEKACLSLAL